MNVPITEMLPLAPLFLAVLLHFVWQATLIVVLVAIGRSLIHPRFFQTRYVLSVVGLLAVLVAPLFTIGYYASSDEAMAAINPVAADIGVTTAAVVDSQSFLSLFEAQFQIVFKWFDNNRFFWLGSWMIGYVVFMTRLCLSLVHCIRLRRKQEKLPPHLEKLARRLQEKLSLTRNIVVASSREITQAVATGIIKPIVLVPTAWVTQLPVSAIEAVLAHELAHVKRWDLWINLLQRIAETVFFFHPLVWWLSQTITGQREICCDQLAIKLTGQPVRYVETLARVAGTTTTDDFDFQFGTAFTGDKNMNLLRRAKMILEPASIDAQSPFRTLTLIACLGLLVSYGSIAYCTTPDPAATAIQDHDHDHHADDHDADHLHEHLSDPDGNIEVIVVQEDDAHQRDVAAKIHEHLAKILHGNHDHHEMARKLRQLADHLEADNNKLHAGHDIHRHVEVHRDANHTIDVEVNPVVDLIRSRIIEVKPVDGSRSRVIEVKPVDVSRNPRVVKVRPHVQLKTVDKPLDVVVDLKLHSHDDDHGHNVHEAKKHDSGQNVFVERIHFGEHGDADAKHTEDLHFGHASTSDDELGRAIRDLKKEVLQLRRELRQLRSERDSPPKERIRYKVKEPREKRDADRKGNVWIEKDTDPAAKGEGRFVFRVKEARADKPSYRFLWVEEKDVKKSEKKNAEYILKEAKEAKTKSGFSWFQKKDPKTAESQRGKKKD